MENARATILYGNRCVVVDRGDADEGASDGALWVGIDDVSRVNGFTVEPDGACRGDLCVPLHGDATRGNLFNLTAFAAAIGQVVVAEPETGVWSFGEVPAPGGGLSQSRIAPDFKVPNRVGRPIHLSDFRGRKVLLLSWASW